MIVERDTSSARSIWSRTVGSEVRTVAPSPNTAESDSFPGPSADARRSASVRSVVTVRKSADASQDTGPSLTRPEPTTAGSASSGPYVVKTTLRAPRPPSGSSRQYGSSRSDAS